MKIFTRQLRTLLIAVVVAVGAVWLAGCGDDSGVNSGGRGSYESVEIGGVKWMTKNLNVKTGYSRCYGEGGRISVEGGKEQTLSSSEIQANCNKYGRLYQWGSAKWACQSIGWRLPDTSDWRKLAEALGNDSTAGNKLKAISGWDSDGNGTDDYGFSALPGGYGDGFLRDPNEFTTYNGWFYSLGKGGRWWLATESNDGRAYTWWLNYDRSNVPAGWVGKDYYYSVRCVADNGAKSGGGSYESVKIGGKKWMKKNLDVEVIGSRCYGEGGDVSVTGTTKPEYVTLSSSAIQDICNTYGRLYTNEAAFWACQSVGWRLPWNAEWEALIKAAGGYSVAGKKLKARSGWDNLSDGSNGSGTDNYGFSALPGGHRYTTRSFSVGVGGYWWTNTSAGGDKDYIRSMSSGVDFMYEEEEEERSAGLSVRCVKD